MLAAGAIKITSGKARAHVIKRLLAAEVIVAGWQIELVTELAWLTELTCQVNINTTETVDNRLEGREIKYRHVIHVNTSEARENLLGYS